MDVQANRGKVTSGSVLSILRPLTQAHGHRLIASSAASLHLAKWRRRVQCGSNLSEQREREWSDRSDTQMLRTSVSSIRSHFIISPSF